MSAKFVINTRFTPLHLTYCCLGPVIVTGIGLVGPERGPRTRLTASTDSKSGDVDSGWKEAYMSFNKSIIRSYLSLFVIANLLNNKPFIGL